MADFDFSSFLGETPGVSASEYVAPPSSSFGIPGVQDLNTTLFGPAFTGNRTADVLQAGGTLSESGVPQGGNWWDRMTSGLGGILGDVAGGAKAIGPLAGLAGTGAGIANSIMGMRQAGQSQAAQRQAMGTQRDISKAVLPSATALTEQGASAMLGGPLPSGIQAQVDDYKRRSMAQINAYLSHAGIADSTMMKEWEMYIDQEATLFGQQLAAGLYGQGLQGLGVAGSGASALSSTASQMSAGVPSSIAAANNSLSRLLAQG